LQSLQSLKVPELQKKAKALGAKDISGMKKQELIKVEVLPKKLDEEVASYMVEGFGGVMTKLSSDQADYINVPEEGPFKSEIYKY